MGRRNSSTENTSVMAKRAPREVVGDTDRIALWRSLDYFPTPPWATRAGAELLAKIDPGDDWVLRDPCCGEGHMVGPLAERYEVLASDIHDHGWAQGWRGGPLVEPRVADWLEPTVGAFPARADWTFMNPPFRLALEFLEAGLRRSELGVAMLVRLAFLESAERHAYLAGEKGSLTVLAPFSERVPMVLGRWQTNADSATAYAWMFWKKGAEPQPPRWIGPGTKARLWKPSDPEFYGHKEPLTLFPGT